MSKLINEDIVLVCLEATSFPDGILEAFDDLKNKIGPGSITRTYFGISRPYKGKIVYRAASSENFQGEAEKLHLEKVILPKGEYETLEVKEWESNMSRIGEAFDKLLMNPRLDPQSYCIEWYLGKDVLCMVKLN